MSSSLMTSSSVTEIAKLRLITPFSVENFVGGISLLGVTGFAFCFPSLPDSGLSVCITLCVSFGNLAGK